jgi:hypothetical protein
MKYILAHDIGTSGNKATLFSLDSGLVGSTVSTYGTHYFNANWAEQDPEDWWRAVCLSTKELLCGVDKHEVLAVSFSGQMMGCLCVDKAGIPLHPSIIWADMRAVEEERLLAEKIDPKQFYRMAGHRISSSYSLENTARSEKSKQYFDEKFIMTAPLDNFEEHLYYLDIPADSDGRCHALVVNDKLGLAVEIVYSKASLPYLVEWKSMNSGDYALGVMPSSSLLRGRNEELAQNGLATVGAFSAVDNQVELTIFDDREAIAKRSQEILAI